MNFDTMLQYISGKELYSDIKYICNYNNSKTVNNILTIDQILYAE